MYDEVKKLNLHVYYFSLLATVGKHGQWRWIITLGYKTISNNFIYNVLTDLKYIRWKVMCSIRSSSIIFTFISLFPLCSFVYTYLDLTCRKSIRNLSRLISGTTNVNQLLGHACYSREGTSYTPTPTTPPLGVRESLSDRGKWPQLQGGSTFCV